MEMVYKIHRTSCYAFLDRYAAFEIICFQSLVLNFSVIIEENERSFHIKNSVICKELLRSDISLSVLSLFHTEFTIQYTRT